MEMGAVWWYARAPPLVTYLAIMAKSRYQDCDRSTKRSMAACETVTGESPGGTPRHFWVPL